MRDMPRMGSKAWRRGGMGRSDDSTLVLWELTSIISLILA
jgi:hypothetical protein